MNKPTPKIHEFIPYVGTKPIAKLGIETSIQRIDNKLETLRQIENEALIRIRRAGEIGRIDDIPSLNDFYLKAKGNVDLYLAGKFGDGVNEMKVCYEFDEEMASYELASGMFTGSIVDVYLNIIVLCQKIEASKGMAKMFPIQEYKRLSGLYNLATNFEAFNVNYYD